jgi:PAS domain-containing protein
LAENIKLEVSRGLPPDISVSPIVLTMSDDITNHRSAEERLGDKEVRLHQLIEQAPDAFFLLDKGRVIEVNQHACDSLGYSRKNFWSMSVFDFK